jgi:hypothetical protein
MKKKKKKKNQTQSDTWYITIGGTQSGTQMVR